MKVFLGGTVNQSTWREEIIPELQLEYFDPVVEEWTDAVHKRELEQRQICDFNLYIITPKMNGFYSIAEVTDDSYHRPERTVYCFLKEDGKDEFSSEQIASLEEVGRRVTSNGGIWCRSMREVINFLNYVAKYGRDGKTNEEVKRNSDYLAAHTYYSKVSQRWHNAGRPVTKLLDGSRLQQASVDWEKLRQKSEEHLPDVTDLMEQFLEASIEKHVAIRKTNLFISYARDPSTPLVRVLYERLKLDYDVWYDKESIPHGRDFKVAIERGIRYCDNFIYVISERSVKSKYCKLELAYAKAYGKRVIPIQHQRGVSNELIDAEIKDLNRIFAIPEGEEEFDFKAMQDGIANVAEESSRLIKEHTDLITLAFQWMEEKLDPRKLLYGQALERFKRWQFDLLDNEWINETKFHRTYLSESAAFAELGFRQLWVVGEDAELQRLLERYFAISYPSSDNQPEDLLRTQAFVYIVTAKSAKNPRWKKQLELARSFKLTIFFLLLDPAGLSDDDVAETDHVLPITPENQLQQIRTLGTRIGAQGDAQFEYFSSITLLNSQAYEWDKRKRPQEYLFRGRKLTYFRNYIQGKGIEIPESTAAFLEASDQVSAFRSFDMYLCRPDSQRNFSLWLRKRLIEEKLVAWDHHDFLNLRNEEDREAMKSGIKRSLNFVIILSALDGDEYFSSEAFHEQLTLANKYEKRIFIVITDRASVPPELSGYPQIKFEDNRGQATYELIEKLSIDPDFVKFFDEYYPYAIKWKEGSGQTLLKGVELANARKQLEGHEKEVPATFIEYIDASQEAETSQRKKRRRNRQILGVVSVIAVLAAIGAIILAVLADASRKEAVKARIDADRQRQDAVDARGRAVKAQKSAEKSRLEARKSAFRASLSQWEAQLATDAAVLARDSTNVARELALKRERDAVKLRRDASKANRLSSAKILAYQVTNTERNLIDKNSRRDALVAYFLFENDGHDTNDTDIYSALFKVGTHDGLIDKNIIRDFSEAIKSYTVPIAPYRLGRIKEDSSFFALQQRDNISTLYMARRINGQLQLRNVRLPALYENALLAPGKKVLWAYNESGLYKVNLVGTVWAERVAIEGQIGKIALAQTGNGNYMLAARTREEIYIIAGSEDKSEIIAETIHIPSDYPEAMAIYGKAGTYSLIVTDASGDVINIHYGSQGRFPRKLRRSIELIVPQDSGPQLITSLAVNDEWVAAGTAGGKVGIAPITGYEISVSSKASTSSIKKIDINSDYYVAITYGNLYDQSTQLIINPIEVSETQTVATGIQHLKRDRTDIVNDALLVNDEIYYIENNQSVKFHTLKATEIARALCESLTNNDTTALKAVREKLDGYYDVPKEKPTLCDYE